MQHIPSNQVCWGRKHQNMQERGPQGTLKRLKGHFAWWNTLKPYKSTSCDFCRNNASRKIGEYIDDCFVLSHCSFILWRRRGVSSLELIGMDMFGFNVFLHPSPIDFNIVFKNRMHFLQFYDPSIYDKDMWWGQDIFQINNKLLLTKMNTGHWNSPQFFWCKYKHLNLWCTIPGSGFGGGSLGLLLGVWTLQILMKPAISIIRAMPINSTAHQWAWITKGDIKEWLKTGQKTQQK